MKNNFLLWPLMAFIISCNSGEEGEVSESKKQSRVNEKTDNIGQVDQEIPSAAKLTYTIEKINLIDDKCEDVAENCSHVNFEYPLFSGSGAIEANKTMSRQLSELMGYGSPNPDEMIDLYHSSERFLEAYHKYLETAESSYIWLAESQLVGHNYYNGFISLKMKTTFDMGGGTPNVYYRVVIFKEETGEEVQLVNHFTDAESIQMLAENVFRNALGYSNDQNLNSKGFTFENDVFKLPINMSLTEEGIELIYNAYEIAPFSKGPTTVLITFDEIGPLLDLENNYNIDNYQF